MASSASNPREGKKGRQDKDAVANRKRKTEKKAKKTIKRRGKGSRPEETDKDGGDLAGAHEPQP